MYILTISGIVFYIVELYTIGVHQVIRAWYRKNQDWTQQLLLKDKPRFLRLASQKTQREGFLKTRKFQYVRRKRHASVSSVASTMTHSSGDTWY